MTTHRIFTTLLATSCAALSLGQTWQATKLQFEGKTIAYAHAYGNTTVGAMYDKERGGYVATIFDSGKPVAIAPKMDGESAAFWMDSKGIAIIEVFGEESKPSTAYWWDGKTTKRITVDKYDKVDVVGAAATGHFVGMAYVKENGVGVPYFYNGSSFKQIDIAGVNNLNAVAMNESETVVLEGNNKDGTRQLYAWKDGNAVALPLIGKKIRGFAVSENGTVAGRDDKGSVVVILKGEKPVVIPFGAGYTPEVTTVQDDGGFVARVYDKKHEDGQLVLGDTTGFKYVSSLLKGSFQFREGWFLPGATYIVANDAETESWYRLDLITVKFDTIEMPEKTIGGANYVAKVRLTAAAPEDTTVKLDYDHSLMTGPDSVVIKKGRTEANFNFNATKTEKKFSLKVGAYSQYGSRTAYVWVYPYTTSSLEATPNYLPEGATTTMILHLPVAAPASGLKVQLEADLAKLVKIPSTIVVPAGATEATFDVTTPGVEENTRVLVSAWFGTTRVVGTFTIRPLRVATFEGNTATAKTGDKITFTVTLEAPAPAGGRVVKFATATPDTLQIPASIKIPTGETKATITATVVSKKREPVKVMASAPANNLFFKVILN